MTCNMCGRMRYFVGMFTLRFPVNVYQCGNCDRGRRL